MIRFSFRTKRFRIKYALNTNGTLRIKFFLSLDPEAPSSGEPTGTNLFAERGQITYIVGDDEWIELEHEITTLTLNNWLKLHAENLDSFAHTVLAQVTIERLEDVI